VTRPNQVLATDIIYVPMARGFVYLVAVVDWFTRRVLAWRVSISAGAEFCIEALEEALARYGTPTIFNSDQGSQFTSKAFTAVLHRENIAISMDSKGCWRDNVFVERLWRSVKYEEVYLNAYLPNGAHTENCLVSWVRLPSTPSCRTTIICCCYIFCQATCAPCPAEGLDALCLGPRVTWKRLQLSRISDA
jgi:transposase InsO family protein